LGAWRLRKLEAFNEFGNDGSDALLRRLRKRGSWLGVGILENDPQAGAVAFVTTGADGARELRQFERERGGVSEIEVGVFRRVRLVRGMGEEIHEDAAGVINEVAETLRDEDSVHIAGRGLFELEKIVIGERVFERDFDGSGGTICVGRNVDGHGAPSLHHVGYFG
jgi:hypothetical protein